MSTKQGLQPLWRFILIDAHYDVNKQDYRAWQVDQLIDIQVIFVTVVVTTIIIAVLLIHSELHYLPCFYSVIMFWIISEYLHTTWGYSDYNYRYIRHNRVHPLLTLIAVVSHLINGHLPCYHSVIMYQTNTYPYHINWLASRRVDVQVKRRVVDFSAEAHCASGLIRT